MAQFLFQHQAGAEGGDILSAGTMAGYGSPASRFAAKAVKEVGVDLSLHRSRPVTPELVDHFDWLIVMTEEHREQLLAHFSGVESKIRLMKSFDPESDGGDVMDPIGLSLDVYRHVRDEIMAAIWGLERFIQEQ